jgi:hypothetical protein
MGLYEIKIDKEQKLKLLILANHVTQYNKCGKKARSFLT